MTAPESALPRNWALRFFSIFTGQAFSLFGSALVQFALIWYLTQATGSATVLATASLFGMLPQILLGPFAGTYVDRNNRRLIMIFADAGIALATLWLAYFFWLNQVETWHIYAALTIRSIGGAFHSPAMSASTTLLVPKEQLARVAGANQTLQGLVSIVAPPAGALLIEVMSTSNILMIDVFTALLGILPLLFFSIPQPQRRAEKPNGQAATFWQDLSAGMRYMFAWRGLLMLGLLATFINFLIAPASALTPLLVTKYFGKGALELGSLDSFFGVGMILGGLTLGAWGGFKKKIVTSLSGIVLFSFAILAMATAPASQFWIMTASMAALGFFMPIVNGPIQALFQSVVAPDMQGRVHALVGSVAQAMMPLGFLIAGPITDATSYQTWFWLAGILNLLLGLGGFLIPDLMNIEENHGAKTRQQFPL